jgi:exosortase/archaeosortase family protein
MMGGHAGRVLAFLLLFAACSLAWAQLTPQAVRDWLIEQLIVVPAAALLAVVDPAVRASAAGVLLAAPAGGVHVRAGCEGADLLFLLVSAMAVAPMGWAARVAGVLAGVALVFVLNLARVIGLLYALQHDRALFDLLHGTLLPLVLVALVCGFFVAWLGRCAPRQQRPALESPP